METASEKANKDLLMGVRQNNLSVMRRAIASGANVDQRLSNEPGCPTLLNGAIPLLKRSTVKLLIDSGADVNSVDDLGYTALIRLAQFPVDVTEAEGVVADLLRARADVNARNNYGMTALDYAADLARYDLKSHSDRRMAARTQDPRSMLRIAEQLVAAGARPTRRAAQEALRQARRLGSDHPEQDR